MDDPVCNPTRLSSDARAGLWVAVIGAILSLCATSSVCVAVLVRLVMNRNVPSYRRRRVISTHLDVYMMSIITSDTCQSVIQLIDIYWVQIGEVVCGRTCTFQGAASMMVEPSSSIGIILLAIHTFLIVALSWRPKNNRLRIPLIIVALSWAYGVVFLICAKLLERPSKTLFAPTPYWCWISDHYRFERFLAAYIWRLSAAGVSTLLYILLFFVIRQNISFDPVRPWRISFHRAQTHVITGRVGGHDNINQGKKALAYPGVQLIAILPYLINRLLSFRGYTIPIWWYFISTALSRLAGLFNVLLLLYVRSRVLGFHDETDHM